MEAKATSLCHVPQTIPEAFLQCGKNIVCLELSMCILVRYNLFKLLLSGCESVVVFVLSAHLLFFSVLVGPLSFGACLMKGEKIGKENSNVTR